MKTAVEWLIEQLYDGKELSTVIRQAKEMEKEQMLDFCWTHSFMTFPDIEDKFNETFKRQQK
jgi:hypothetical protein